MCDILGRQAQFSVSTWRGASAHYKVFPCTAARGMSRDPGGGSMVPYLGFCSKYRHSTFWPILTLLGLGLQLYTRYWFSDTIWAEGKQNSHLN